MNEEIQGENQNQLEDLIGIYGESKLIHYLAESLINKEERLSEHLK